MAIFAGIKKMLSPRMPVSWAHTALWGFTHLFFGLGLLYYAITKIQAIMSLEIYLMVSETPISGEFLEWADFVICGIPEVTYSQPTWFGPSGTVDGPNQTVSTWDISTSQLQAAASIPKFLNWPCTASDKSLTIISLQGGTVNASLIQGYSLTAISTGNNIYPLGVTLMSNRSGNGVYRTEYIEMWRRDGYAFTASNAVAVLQWTPAETYTRRSDFWGLMGSRNDQPEYSVTTSFRVYQRGGPINTEIQVFLPTSRSKQEQKLITTIPSAFSSWGGAFSIIATILVFLFGSSRLQPFGFATSCCFRKRTKKFLRGQRRLQETAVTDHQRHLQGRDSTQGPEITLNLQDGIGDSDEKARTPTLKEVQDLNIRLACMEAVLKEHYLEMGLFDDKTPK